MFSPQRPLPRANVIVADDHPVVALGVCQMLEGVEHIHLVAAAVTISELFEALAQVHCDVLICDYSFEDDSEPDGTLLLKRIRRLYPDLKIILLTGHDDVVIMQMAVEIGVSGFLSKSSRDFSSLPAVITRVLQGEKYLDPETSKVLVQHMMTNNLTSQSLTTAQLTARELEVLRMFSRGMSVTDIAQHTNRSVKTISTQKKKAMLKLGVMNDIELLKAFNQMYATLQ
ncbi:response regulator [Pseudomonas canadensis]|uniref:response regulator n=1 Tax=Pseudomonas canadensis TaxID=915099 RepID=UPI003BA24DEF